MSTEAFLAQQEEQASGTGFGHLTDLSAYQKSLLQKVEDLHAAPMLTEPSCSTRTAEQVNASREMHKRINSGYVDLRYTSSNQEDFKYIPPPDFTRDYLKSKSDQDFQGYMSEAILKHVDLKKTSH